MCISAFKAGPPAAPELALRPALVSAALALLLLMAACADRHGAELSTGPVWAPDAAAVFPGGAVDQFAYAGQLPVPDLLDALRGSRAQQDLTLSGADTLQHSSGAVPQGASCQIDASESGLNGGTQAEWAIYSFYAGGELDVLSLQLDLDVAPASVCWVLGADFTQKRWTPLGSFDAAAAAGGVELLGGGAEDYISPASYLYCAILCDKGNQALVGGLSLKVDITGNVPPNAVLSPASVSGEAPLLVELDASVSNAGGDIGDSIVLYEWDIDGDGVVDLAGPEDKQSFNFVAGAWVATVWVTDAGGLKASAGCELNISAPASQPPNAILAADKSSGPFPLTVNFDGSASDGGADGDALVKFEWDWDGRGVYDLDSGTDPTVSHTYLSASAVAPRLRVTDAAGNQDFAQLDLAVFDPDNNPPLAVLSASPTYASSTPFVVDFDASASNAGGDPGDSIVEYNWLFDNGSNYVSSGSNPLISHTYYSPGQRKVLLLVTDEAGNTDKATVTINCGFGPQELAPLSADSELNQFMSMALVAGRPALAYYDPASSCLRYMRAKDSTGVQWNEPVLVNNDGAVGSFNCLAVISGRPAISYYKGGSSGDLMYVRAADADGGNWPAPVTVWAADDVGAYTQLAEVAGRPAIACLDYTHNGILYTRSLDSSGSSWGSAENQIARPDGGGMGFNLSMALVGGRPALAYGAFDYSQIRFVRATDSSGTAWEAPQLLDSTPGSSRVALSALSSGRAAVVYETGGIDGDAVRYRRASNDANNQWTAPFTLDDDTAGSGVSMCLVQLSPVALWSDFTVRGLQCGKSKDAVGGTWHTPEQQVYWTESGYNFDCMEVGGMLGVAYIDAEAGKLKYYWGY